MTDDSFVELDFRFHFALVIYTRFNIECGEDGREPQKNGAVRKVFSRTDPTGGTENPILRIFDRWIELPIF